MTDILVRVNQAFRRFPRPALVLGAGAFNQLE